MTKLRLILKFIFFLPGTFLHELAHYIVALILGKAEGFSVWPKVEGGSFVFGSVKSRTRFKVLSSFIAIAPLFWWIVLLFVLRSLHFVGMSNGTPKIHFGVVFDRLRHFSPSGVLLLWLLTQILWAGSPSYQDIKNFFSGFLSVSGFALFAIVAGLIYIVKMAG